MEKDVKKIMLAKTYQQNQANRLQNMCLSYQLKDDYDNADSILDLLRIETKTEMLRKVV